MKCKFFRFVYWSFVAISPIGLLLGLIKIMSTGTGYPIVIFSGFTLFLGGYGLMKHRPEYFNDAEEDKQEKVLDYFSTKIAKAFFTTPIKDIVTNIKEKSMNDDYEDIARKVLSCVANQLFQNNYVTDDERDRVKAFADALGFTEEQHKEICRKYLGHQYLLDNLLHGNVLEIHSLIKDEDWDDDSNDEDDTNKKPKKLPPHNPAAEHLQWLVEPGDIEDLPFKFSKTEKLVWFHISASIEKVTIKRDDIKDFSAKLIPVGAGLFWTKSMADEDGIYYDSLDYEDSKSCTLAVTSKHLYLNIEDTIKKMAINTIQFIPCLWGCVIVPPAGKAYLLDFASYTNDAWLLLNALQNAKNWDK